jgi:hypothetical protein
MPLAHYVGWGTLSNVFNPYQNYGAYEKWKKANARFKALLTREQMTAAEAKVPNAHYTSPQIARFSWASEAPSGAGRTTEQSIEALRLAVLMFLQNVLFLTLQLPKLQRSVCAANYCCCLTPQSNWRNNSKWRQTYQRGSTS